MRITRVPLVIGAVAIVVLVGGAAGVAAAVNDPAPMTGCLRFGNLTNVAVGEQPARPCPNGASRVTWNQKQSTDQALVTQVAALQSDVAALQTQVAQMSLLLKGVTASDTSWQVQKGTSVMRIDSAGTSKLEGQADVLVKGATTATVQGTSTTVQGTSDATLKAGTTATVQGTSTTIQGTNDATLKAGTTATLRAGTTATVQGTSTTVEGTNDATLKGSTATVNGLADATVEGGNVTVDAGAEASVKAGTAATVQAPGQVTVKGGITSVGGGTCVPAAGQGGLVTVNPITGIGTITLGRPTTFVC